MKTFHITSRRTLAFLAAILSAQTNCIEAAGLKQAEFTRVINDVRVMPIQQQPSPARIGDKISGQTGVSTGASSRAELTFPDKTITRIGANSLFKLDKAERTVDLEKGVILLQVPKQIGGAKVRTAAVTAAVTGTTVMVEYAPDGAIKIIVLEGEVDVYLNDNPSVMRTLVAGDMYIQPPNLPPDTKELPLPVKIDLELLKKTSKLMDIAEFGPLGNQKHLADALGEQKGLKEKGELLKTAFEIMGRGTQVTLTNEARQEIGRNLTLRDRPTPNGGGGGNNSSNGGGNFSENVSNVQDNTPSPTSNSPTKPIFNPGTTAFGAGSSIVTNPHATAFNSIAGGVTTMQGTIYQPLRDGPVNTYLYSEPQTTPTIDAFIAARGNWFTFLGEDVFISGNISVNTSPGPRNLLIASQNNLTLTSSAGVYGVLTDSYWDLPANVDTVVFAAHGSITQDSSFSISGSGSSQSLAYYALGQNSDVILQGYAGGDSVRSETGPLMLGNSTVLVSAGRDALLNNMNFSATENALEAGRDISVSNSTLAAERSTKIKAARHVTINSSSLLRALVEAPEGVSTFIAAINGDVNLDGTYIEGKSTEITSVRGNVNIAYSGIYTDIIKARTFSTGGQLWINNSILGNSASPASLVKLYGEGVSGVRFSGDSQINSLLTDIAGSTVTIDNGSIVRLSHPSGARVFTDNANFNNGTHGNFTDSGGTPTAVTKSAYGSRPGF